MARSWQYPRWRRMVMQVILLLILAGTAGLAELVSRQRNRDDVPDLNQVQKIDRLRVQLPAGWDVNEEEPNELIAQEPSPDGQGRMMAVRLMHAKNAHSAAEFLKRSGLLNPNSGPEDQQDDESDDSDGTNNALIKTQPIPMAGQQGAMAHVIVRERSLPDLSPVLHNQLIAAVVLPTQTAIVVQLDSTEPDLNGDDERLLKRVAAALAVDGETKP